MDYGIMEAWQERLLEERDELRGRLERLNFTIGRRRAGRLEYEPLCAMDTLVEQRDLMRDYLMVLEERIGAELDVKDRR